jgi:hypothetical protein
MDVSGRRLYTSRDIEYVARATTGHGEVCELASRTVGLVVLDGHEAVDWA